MIGDETRKIAKSKEINKLNFKTTPFKPPKIRKPIRWFWKRWWWIDFWYDQTHNGIWGPGGRTYYSFRTGKLALIISIIAFIMVLTIFIKVIF